MKKLIVLVALITGCTLSHNAALELRYSAAVALAGGTLTTLAPVFNGDGFNHTTSTIGTSINVLGIGLLAASIAVDPELQGQRPLLGPTCR